MVKAVDAVADVVEALIRLFLRRVAEDESRFVEACRAIDVPIYKAAESSELWPCPYCDRVLSSCKAFNAHLGSAHKVGNPARKFVLGSVCPKCKWDFQSRYRLRMHLSRGRTECVLAMRAGLFPEYSAEEIAAADAQEQSDARELRAAGKRRGQGLPAMAPF